MDLNDDRGDLVNAEWLARAEVVHRQLRADLPSDYLGKMRRVFAEGGRMCVALDADQVAGVAVYRVYENTVWGKQMYVDDLVTDETRRSKGIGRMLLEHLQGRALATGCRRISLDSGVQRSQAHKFYFREGMVVCGFHFGKDLPSSRSSSPVGTLERRRMTGGVDHVGLSVRDVRASADFFVRCLEWDVVGERPDYPALYLSDGCTRLTLWQVTDPMSCRAFDRHRNIGLHHLALKVGGRAELGKIFDRVREWPGVEIEFAPEPSGRGPKVHAMFREPGGTRIELAWDPGR